MFNPNKFNYQPLSRENIDGERKYNSPDGEKLPSVTTILSATTPEEKIAILNAWRNRIGHKQAQNIVIEASSRGTRMHKWLENYVKTGNTEDPGSNPYSKQSHSMAHTIIKQGLNKCSEFWGTEVNLYFPKIYAGTTDLIGIHDGSEAIIDFKQANKIKKKEWIDDYFLQLCAYSDAHNIVYGTSIKKGIILMCTPNLEYQEFIIEGSEFQKYTTMWWKRVEDYYLKFV